MMHREWRDRAGGSLAATHAALVAFARRLVDADTAEDLVQEAFVRLIAGGRPEAACLPLPYLKVVVRNLAMDAYTRRTRDTAAKRAVERSENDAVPPAAEGSTLEVDLQERLSELSARQWESLVMTVVLGMTEHEAASAADVSRSAVAGSRDRALHWLRAAIQKSPGGPTPRLAG
jgi:RNA polymerase sigma-70 factor (ECF subfamily)